MSEFDRSCAMVVSLKSLGIDKLSLDDRVVLFHEIGKSIEEESGRPMLTVAQRKELIRRKSQHEADPESGIPWSEVKRDVLAQLNAQ
jgi:putative addiction module component (TIGR02574 family)